MNIRLTSLLLILLPSALCSTLAFAEVSQPISGQLKNGLKYTILPLHHDKNRLDVRMRVNAGSVDELDHQAGVAHMVEHLVFRATAQHPNGIMPYLHSHKWQRAKHYNAVTNNESTTYMMSPPVQFGLNKTLNVLHEMLFNAQLTQHDLDLERQIILEEWRGGQGVASRMNLQRTQSVREHSRYARHQPIGNQKNIETLPATELQHFYKTWYVPNNMHLLIVGDVQPQTAIQAIEQQFSAIPARPLAQRDYYEPKLVAQLRIHPLGDAQSAVSQIAYIFRFDEAKHREMTREGRKQRLIDRIALAWLEQRLKNEQAHLTGSVKSLVSRKSDIGKTSVALGIFASVENLAHRDGLRQILQEIQRLQHYPMTDDELAQQKKKIQAQLDTAKQHNNDRDFAKWVQVMTDTEVIGKPYMTQKDIAEQTQPLLDSITTQDIAQRVQQWFNSPDQIVQYQTPNQQVIPVITVVEVEQLKQNIAQQIPTVPQNAIEIENKQFTPMTQYGTITHKTILPQQVEQWQLSNGDRVVWLKSAVAGNQTYFHAISSAGFLRPDLINWQSQFASQLMAQSSPHHWTATQLEAWKRSHKVNLSFKLDAHQFHIEGNAPVQNTSDLLRLYYATQQEIQLNQGLDEVKQAWQRQLKRNSEQEQQRLQQIQRLRGLSETAYLPNAQQLEQLNYHDLQQQWQRIQRTPTTFYIVNNATAIEMQRWVQQFLAPIARQATSSSSRPSQTPQGRDIQHFAYHIEPKHDVQMWLNIPHQWQGHDAMLISFLKHIASQKLKNVLRDEQLGIYRLNFESTLNPETNQIESELKFTTAPNKSQQMVALAEQVLADLPQLIQEQDVRNAKAQFLQQEQARLQRPETWLNRLILSDQHYGDSRYLKEMLTMAEHIQLDKLRALAKKMYHADAVKVMIYTQVESIK